MKSIGLLVLIIGSISFLSCQKQNTKVKENHTSNLIKIKLCKISLGNYNIKQPIYGEVQNQANTYISSPIGGILKAVYVKNGQNVRKGQIIATLDTRVYQDKAMAIDNDIKAIAKKLEYYKSQYERAKKLYNLGSMSYEQFSQIRTNLALTEGELKKNIYLERSIKDEASYGIVKAPFDGIVSNVIPQGSNVSPGSPIAYISAKNIYAKFYIPFNTKLSQDDTVEFQHHTYPLKVFEDEKSRLSIILPVSYKENPGNSLKAFIIKNIQGMKVPSSAVILYNNTPSVFVDISNNAKNIPVKILGNMENYYIISPIGYQEVICKGAKLLKDGEKLNE